MTNPEVLYWFLLNECDNCDPLEGMDSKSFDREYTGHVTVEDECGVLHTFKVSIQEVTE